MKVTMSKLNPPNSAISSSAISISISPPFEVSTSSTPPTYIQSILLQLQTSCLANHIDEGTDLPEWFITNILQYKNTQLPRLLALECGVRLIENQVSNPKYMNTLFLEDQEVVRLLRSCLTLVDIAYILTKHLQLKIKSKQLSSRVLDTVKLSVQDILRNNQSRIQFILCVSDIYSYISQKQRLPDSVYKIQKFYLEQNEKQICLIYTKVIKLLFQKRNLQQVYQLLHPIIYWFCVVNNDSDPKEIVILDMAKKIDTFLWMKKTSSNFNLIGTFVRILDLLACRYHKDDAYSPFSMSPLLLKLHNIPYPQLIQYWVSSNNLKPNLQKQIQNIFRNTLFTGCSIFNLKIIQSFSNYLHQIKKYDILFHLFDSFIRKDYLSIKLPDGAYLKNYINILMFYAIGFINRDRLDGQNQLDRLAANLSELVCKNSFKYDLCYMEIIKFFRIYENRFQFLSPTSKKFVTQLEKIYKVNIPIAALHQEVGNRIFKEYSADYQDDQIYVLRKSNRYSGLINIGNTCYLNSFMQSLFMTKKFKSLVIKAKDEGTVPVDHPIFHTLADLFSELSCKTTENKTDVNPACFKEQIPEPFKSSTEQHDSGQFGRMYLDMVTSQLKDTSLAQKINRLFTHELVTKIICKKCKTEKKRQQKIFDFILNVSDSTTEEITVSELMKNYCKGYQVDENNLIFCENCNQNMPTVIIPQPMELAEHLITTIGIFRYDASGGSKIVKPLNFQFSLNFKNILPKIVTEDQIYELYAFVVHIGTGVQRGHYQCFARNLEQNPMVWYKFDDHYVTQQQISSINDFHFGYHMPNIVKTKPHISYFTETQKNQGYNYIIDEIKYLLDNDKYNHPIFVYDL